MSCNHESYDWVGEDYLVCNICGKEFWSAEAIKGETCGQSTEVVKTNFRMKYDLRPHALFVRGMGHRKTKRTR